MGQEKAVKLTMSLLCSGRAEETKKCLESLSKIRESVSSEILVIDTGCDEQTRQIINKYADKICEFTWCNDFAKARNFQLENASGEWFLYIDDDEFFEDSDAIIEFFTTQNTDAYGYGGYTVRNYMDFDGEQWIDSRVLRLVKLTEDTHFIGKIHERLEGFAGGCIYFDSIAGHYGYCYQDEEELLAHAKRNIPLLHEMIQESPDDLNWPVQLIQEYKAIGDIQNIVDTSKEYIRRIRSTEYADGDKALGIFYIALIQAMEKAGDISAIFEIYDAICDDARISDLARATCLLVVIPACLVAEKYEECVDRANHFISIYEKLVEDAFQRTYQEGILLNETLNEASLSNVYCNLMAAGLKLGDLEFIDKYCDKVNWNAKSFKLSRGYILFLIETGMFRENENRIAVAFDALSQNNELVKIVKKELSDIAMDAPNELLINLQKYVGEELSQYISLQLRRKSDPQRYDEMYLLEQQIIEQIQHLLSEGKTAEAQIVQIQIKDILMNTFGVETLQV